MCIARCAPVSYRSQEKWLYYFVCVSVYDPIFIHYIYILYAPSREIVLYDSYVYMYIITYSFIAHIFIFLYASIA